jgi:hypothetical protein
MFRYVSKISAVYKGSLELSSLLNRDCKQMKDGSGNHPKTGIDKSKATPLQQELGQKSLLQEVAECTDTFHG